MTQSNCWIKGIDPAQIKRVTSEEGVLSFEAVAMDWFERKKPTWDEKHANTNLYRLSKYAFPHIGCQSINSIQPTDVLSFLRILEKQGKIETATRTLNICSQVFRYAVACGICNSDPCRDLKGALTSSKSVPRAAITKTKDIGALMASIDTYNGYPVVRAVLIWSALTFCRPGEVRRAEWSEIDFEAKEWRIPAEKMKMRFEHRVPLATQAIILLKELKELCLSDTWIFPSPRAGRPLSDVAVLAALRRMGYTKDEMCAHGFRAMASTCLNELGYRPDVIERQLAHGDKDKIRAVYNRAAYMDERRVMMQEWADYLDKLKANHFERCHLARQ